MVSFRHMSNVKSWQIKTTGAAQTEALGEQIGSQLRGGEVIELSSDLGGGKTTFVRGLARGAGSTNHVSSPTFTVSQVYDTATRRIYHFDFYRLGEAGIMSQELAEMFQDPEGIFVIEWSDVIHDVLPADRLTVRLERVSSGEDDRTIVMTTPDSRAYLLAKVQDAVTITE